MDLRLSVDGIELDAVLHDNPTARAWAATLPQTVTLEDFNDTEKIAYLSDTLPTDGAPASMTPQAGDIALYAPWGNLAIYYRDFRSSPGLVRLGRITSDFASLARIADGTSMTIRLA